MSASLSFVAWARQGAASAITTADALAPAPSATANVAAKLVLNGRKLPDVAIRLRGPADAAGIDPNQVIRTDPRPNATDFESNCFASIEFDRPDLPWVLTPAKANAKRQLRPWICLVVVRKQPGVSLDNLPGSQLPVLRIAAPARVDLELPDLADCWAWAHAQAAAADSTPQPVTDALNGPPGQNLSRLVSPRILAPETDYLACVVPTFDVGRLAGLGQALPDVTAPGTLTPSWSFSPAVPNEVLLPVYYSWSFHTGPGGDFQAVATGLTPNVPAGLGTRTIDVSAPGFNPAGARTVALQGALRPVGAAAPETPLPALFVSALAGILNAPGNLAALKPGADPVLAPPIYGRWHAADAAVDPAGRSWLDQLNLDPRWRATAAFGTRVVQEHQEALMASAWEQAAEVRLANQRLLQLQVSRSVGEVLHARHFAKFSDEMMARVTAPAFGRLRRPGGATMAAQQESSPLPMAANGAAMRRIGRQRGPLTRRAAGQKVDRAANPTWVARLMSPPPPALAAAAPALTPVAIGWPDPGLPGGVPTLPAPPPGMDLCPFPTSPTQHLGADSFFGSFLVFPERTLNPMAGPFLLTGRTELPGFFRDAALKHLARAFAPPPAPADDGVDPEALKSIKAQVLDLIRPEVALAPLVAGAIETGDNVLAPTAPGVAASGLETIMASPRFPSPMYAPLRDLSQDLLLPGLETVLPETVLGLQTNERFVEAYMVGLNHEMGRELLWRGFPTDQRGTYFTHFWDADDAAIEDLNLWGGQALGAGAAAAAGDQFVLLLRSSLLRRYPNAVIYMTPALALGGGLAPDPDPAHEKMPSFSGSMQPDICFFGFPLSAPAATGDDGRGGHYLVIQEHPTAPRFGLNAGTAPAGISYLSVGGKLPTGLRGWPSTSSAVAGALRRRPARVAIHAKRLIAQAG